MSEDRKRLTQEKYWEEDLKLKKQQVIALTFLAMIATLLAYYTFTKQIADFWSNTVSTFVVVSILVLWIIGMGIIGIKK
jgi:membrane-bound ClpP family serine protease